MMISPEIYYEMYLKGRSAEQIQSAIRSLKSRMGHLKRKMEDPGYNDIIHVCPDESVQLSCMRDYLERAKQALAEAGGEYKPSRAELAAAQFNENIPAIHTLKLTVYGYFDGCETYTVTLNDEHPNTNAENSIIFEPSNFDISLDYPMTKNAFLDYIRDLNMGEWRHSYDAERFGYVVLDGSEWELEITYSNGHDPVRFCGYNVFPYNFDKLKDLFGISEDPVPDDEDYEDDE